MIKTVRYDLIGAGTIYNINEHPQIDMINHGYKLIKSKACPIADCWFFMVEDKNVKKVPPYIHPSDYKFEDVRTSDEIKNKTNIANKFKIISVESVSFVDCKTGEVVAIWENQ